MGLIAKVVRTINFPCAALAVLGAVAGASIAVSVPLVATAQDEGMDLSDFAGSPLNFKNSENNFNNSPNNIINSPVSWGNNPENPARLNVIGLLGRVIGYAVPKKDGGVNYFDNDGVRVGYSPDGGVNQYQVDGDETEFEVKRNDAK